MREEETMERVISVLWIMAFISLSLALGRMVSWWIG